MGRGNKSVLGEHCAANDKRKEMKKAFKERGAEESELSAKERSSIEVAHCNEIVWSSEEVEETETRRMESQANQMYKYLELLFRVTKQFEMENILL